MVVSPPLPQDLQQYLVEGVDRAGQAEMEAVGRHPWLRAAVRERVAVLVKSGVSVRPHDRQLRHVQHVGMWWLVRSTHLEQPSTYRIPVR